MSGPSPDKPALGVDTATAAASWAVDPAVAASSADWGLPAAVLSTWKPQLPYRSRPKPRVYGKGRYGIDKYDSRDDTRYSWSRVAAPLAALLIGLLGLVTPARATNAYCESADVATSIYGLCKPSVNVEGVNAWGDKWNTNLDMLETDLSALATSSGAIAARTTALETLAAALGVSTASLAGSISALQIWQGTATVSLTNLGVSTAALSASTSTLSASTAAVAARVATLEQAGATDYVHTDGSNGMTGPLTLVNDSTLTVSGNSVSVGGSSFSVVGGTLTVAYGGVFGATVTAGNAAMGGWVPLPTTAMWGNRQMDLTVSGNEAMTQNTGGQTRLNSAPNTALTLSVGGNTAMSAWSDQETDFNKPATFESSASVKGNAFSVGGATLSVAGGYIVTGATLTFGVGGATTTMVSHVGISTGYLVSSALATDQGNGTLWVNGLTTTTFLAVTGSGINSCSNPMVQLGAQRTTGISMNGGATGSINLCSSGSTSFVATAAGIQSSSGFQISNIGYSTITVDYSNLNDARSGLGSWQGVQGRWILVSSGNVVMEYDTSGSTSPTTGQFTWVSGGSPLGNSNVILQTTYTFQGSRFSVGGSTFVIKDSSVAIGNSSPAAATLEVVGSVQIGSGTTKSTFTAGGSLTLGVNDTLTLSGTAGNINTASSVTASAFYGDGSHLTGVTSSQFCTKLDTATFSGISTYTFVEAFDATHYYALHFDVLKHTAGVMQLIFNSDTAANYNNQNFIWETSGTSPFGTATDSLMPFVYNSAGAKSDDNTDVWGDIYFRMSPNNTHTARMWGEGYSTRSALAEADNYRGVYTGARNLDRVSIYASAGTFDGTFSIYQCNLYQ